MTCGRRQPDEPDLEAPRGTQVHRGRHHRVVKADVLGDPNAAVDHADGFRLDFADASLEDANLRRDGREGRWRLGGRRKARRQRA